ncbi:hypothetical protein SDC9_86357 [bioreactor metagenome]|uniref:Uncharacterized protein n=1 Tax=bioreactor metagenome TaxID=1076179 RepID=A0A644ZLY6_9ZZZZ
MENERRAGRTFLALAVLLVLASAVKWLYFDPEIIALSQNFQIDSGLLFASRMSRLTILLCAFLLPPLAIKAKFCPPQWAIGLLFAMGAGFDLWYILTYASGMGLIPQMDILSKTWTFLYYTDKNMLYIVLPQLPIALAVAMGGRRERAETDTPAQETVPSSGRLVQPEDIPVPEEIPVPDEMPAPPPNTPDEKPPHSS